MTPKEKAVELYNKYEQLGKDFTKGVSMAEFAKQCALIAVDEIFEFMKMDDEYTETVSNANSKWVDYWLEVKKEIEKL
jgi:hypothetical protein